MLGTQLRYPKVLNTPVPRKTVSMGGRVRLLTQETRVGKPARALAQTKPNPMVKDGVQSSFCGTEPST